MPNLIAVGAEISPPDRRASTITTIFVGFPAGGAVASLITLSVLAGVAPKSFDWRLVYLVGGLAALVVAPIAFVILPETKPAHAGERRDVLNVLFGEGRAAATLCLCLAFACTTVLLYLMVGWLPTLVVGEGHTRIQGALAALSFNVAGLAGGVAIGLAVDRLALLRPMIGKLRRPTRRNRRARRRPPSPRFWRSRASPASSPSAPSSRSTRSRRSITRPAPARSASARPWAPAAWARSSVRRWAGFCAARMRAPARCWR